MKRIMMPIIAMDYFATSGRVAYLAKALAREYHVEILTIAKDVVEDIAGKIGDVPNLDVRLLEHEFLNLPFSYRDGQAAIFVSHVYDLSLPGTSLKIWDIGAFDDFWGHLSNCTFKQMGGISADFVLLPLISREDHPPDDGDVFYTTIMSKAKEAGIKIVGYQIYPVFSSLMLMPRLMDAIIVREDYEKQFYEKHGIDGARIHIITDVKDRYSLGTIEDIYMNNIYNDQIEISCNDLSVVVCNHDKYRPQLKAVFKILAKTGTPIALFLVKREFTVRDLSEDQIIQGIYHDDIRKITRKFYQVEHQSLATVLMLADIVISPSFITPLEFAVRYGKKAAVFNPFAAKIPDIKGIAFMRTEEDLISLVKQTHREKTATTGVRDVLSRISKG